MRRNELIEASTVRDEYAEIATVVTARMRAVPDGVADQVAGLPPGGRQSIAPVKD